MKTSHTSNKLQFLVMVGLLLLLAACGGGGGAGAGNADVEPVLGAEHAAKKLEQIVIAPFMSSFPAGSHVPLSTTAIYS
ncbi:MAG: hypothetical protein GY770_32255, partial [Aestuariibacter sp.]|nr:hypothetical protein [Aestuariibacter sp.]